MVDLLERVEKVIINQKNIIIDLSYDISTNKCLYFGLPDGIEYAWHFVTLPLSLVSIYGLSEKIFLPVGQPMKNAHDLFVFFYVSILSLYHRLHFFADPQSKLENDKVKQKSNGNQEKWPCRPKIRLNRLEPFPFSDQEIGPSSRNK